MSPLPQKTGAKGGGRRGRNKSQFGMQLAEKQQLKRVYGVRDEQLRRYFRLARRQHAETGPALIVLLESRLDNAVFRASMAETRAQARQMVSHRFFTVNGRPVNIPSYGLSAGDTVQIKEGKRSKAYFTSFEKRMQNAHLPSWLALKVDEFGFAVTGSPSSEEAALGVHVQSVVELLGR
ncbi:MAG: 30S ribosomal protein S4 [Candidatus Andersenbacteria bacterium CG10_big_fil_rev_8_21_14_0_10_54_11]|uniref:Small ribosomal subunit protein uS4 n=1 Tax=Candidatus Andersenbacteria bacterium CG10_big_fil_rev_8_21_14_0_10_54_11 TaxID=1974485 RepID=A0A2M6WYG3_9BACT|nr:MAG: 30S ribosomal protein S4 [Candidatus Andersenbacteria bacterium CG10_big_fil_rev_8_21_14_0_10_54_11]